MFFFVLGYEENTWCIVLKNITSKTTGIEKNVVTSSIHVLDKNVKLGTFTLSCNCAAMAKKCTKECDAYTEFVVLQIEIHCFLVILIAVAITIITA